MYFLRFLTTCSALICFFFTHSCGDQNTSLSSDCDLACLTMQSQVLQANFDQRSSNRNSGENSYEQQIQEQINALSSQIEILKSSTTNSSRELAAKVNAVASATSKLQRDFQNVRSSSNSNINDYKNINQQVLALLTQMNGILIEIRREQANIRGELRNNRPQVEDGLCFLLPTFDCRSQVSVKKGIYAVQASANYKYFSIKKGERKEHFVSASIEKGNERDAYAFVCNKIQGEINGLKKMECGTNQNRTSQSPCLVNGEVDTDCDGAADKNDRCPGTRPGDSAWLPGKKGFKPAWWGCAGGQEPTLGGKYIK